MVQLQKVPQPGGTWRILDGQGEIIGRIKIAAHIDRFLRDGDLGEKISAALALSGAARRQAARTAYQEWATAGGHSVDFSALTISLNNDGGIEDGNLHIYLGGAALGWLNGHNDLSAPIVKRIQRFIRLAEEAFAAEQLIGNAARNAALDALIDRFRDDGALD